MLLINSLILAYCGSIIKQKVVDRVNASRLPVTADWNKLLNKALDKVTKGTPDEQELKARQEKVSALKEIAESRFSVLMAPWPVLVKRTLVNNSGFDS